jgi:FG-GAP-like repeat/IPT/TIG domain/Secretion system C-terminal sorting domain/FG-GAP repeat
MSESYKPAGNKPKPILQRKFFFIIAFFLQIQALFGQPVIDSFSPRSGPIGTMVTIQGRNFDPAPANNIVFFGAVQAKVSSATGNLLVVAVPTGATFQPITVTSSGLTSYSAYPFIVTFSQGAFTLGNVFTQKVDFDGGPTPGETFIGDFDGDGKADLVIANNNSYYISILQNTGAIGTISLTPRITYLTLANAISVCAADLDGDGRLDLAVACIDANGIAIFRNTGVVDSIAFGPKLSYDVGLQPTCIAVRDLDGDGRPDLVVINSGSNSISVFRNTSTIGNISFAPKVDFPCGPYPLKASIADLDQDGKPDLAVINRYGNSVSLFKNTCTPGIISFAAKVDYSTNSRPIAISIGDLDGDGNNDLVITNADTLHSVSIFRNMGGATLSFAPRQDLDAGAYPLNVAIADLNGDGKPDLAVPNVYDGKVTLLTNTSNIGLIYFAAKIEYSISPGDLPFLAIGDLDQNGKPDLALSNSTYGKISVFRNLGNEPRVTSFTPTFAGPGATITINGTNFTAASSVDFGGTTAASFAVLNDSVITAVVASGATGNVSVTTANGTGGLNGFSFTSQLVITSFSPAMGPAGTMVTVQGANFDANPLNNFVYFGPVKATIAKGNTTSLTFPIPPGGSFSQISVTTHGLTTYSNQSFTVIFPGAAPIFNPRTFAPKKDFVAGPYPQKICIGDLDGDGKPDLAVSNYASNTISIFKNTSLSGLVSFEPQIDYVSGNNPSQISMADLDGDGRIDIIVANTHSNTISVFRNTSSGGKISFARKLDFATIERPLSLSVGDLDGDGRPDFIVGNVDSSTISIFKNTSSPGMISFESKNQFPVLSFPIEVYLRDFDGDGKPDLVVIPINSWLVGVYRNTSTIDSISFTYVTELAANTDPFTLSSADMNGDGKPDLIVGNSSANTFSIYCNTGYPGSISFRYQQQFVLGAPNTLSVGDLDGDGKPDLAASNPAANRVDLFKNITNNLFTFDFAGLSFSTGNYPIGISIADLDGDGKPELASANYSTNTITILRNTVGEASVVPSGANPVSDTIIVNRPIIDSVVQTYNGQPFVQRHYDIQPISNPAHSTATITLFFLQSEFDNFNAFPSHGPDLPTNPTDTAGIANLRIYQYHGLSATNLPGGYSGPGIEINPDDSNIIWNPDTQFWEVTFNVNGFSGFFLSSKGFLFIAPSAPTIRAGGDTVFCKGDSVALISSAPSNNHWYKNDTLISAATDSIYQVNTSGRYSASTTTNGMASPRSISIEVTVKPVPDKPTIARSGTNLVSSSVLGNQWYREEALINSANNQVYKPLNGGNYTVKVTMESCTGPESDKYYFSDTALINMDSTHFVKLNPNPAKGSVTLSFNVEGSTTLNLCIIDLQGRRCEVFENLMNGAAIDITKLVSGIYIVKISSGNGKLSYVLKLIKQ